MGRAGLAGGKNWGGSRSSSVAEARTTLVFVAACCLLKKIAESDAPFTTSDSNFAGRRAHVDGVVLKSGCFHGASALVDGDQILLFLSGHGQMLQIVRRGHGHGQDKARRRKIWLPKAAALITILFGSTRPAIRSGVTGRVGLCGDASWPVVVPGLLLELKRGCRVDAVRRDRRRGAHDERDEGRAHNRLAALRRDERPLPAGVFFFESVVRVATASEVFSCGDGFHHR